jgi:hypothetical protein
MRASMSWGNDSSVPTSEASSSSGGQLGAGAALRRTARLEQLVKQLGGLLRAEAMRRFDVRRELARLAQGDARMDGSQLRAKVGLSVHFVDFDTSCHCGLPTWIFSMTAREG